MRGILAVSAVLLAVSGVSAPATAGAAQAMGVVPAVSAAAGVDAGSIVLVQRPSRSCRWVMRIGGCRVRDGRRFCERFQDWVCDGAGRR